jgi:hypothetical protein
MGRGRLAQCERANGVRLAAGGIEAERCAEGKIALLAHFLIIC